eukprot:GHVP01004072.1.p1 GENE.GHVP01004072.1~~GHVP01004072.1.p1  ORF type:complete len:1104 (-),score=237.73 GHVP01004072.1:5118-8015(-)
MEPGKEQILACVELLIRLRSMNSLKQVFDMTKPNAEVQNILSISSSWIIELRQATGAHTDAIDLSLLRDSNNQQGQVSLPGLELSAPMDDLAIYRQALLDIASNRLLESYSPNVSHGFALGALYLRHSIPEKATEIAQNLLKKGNSTLDGNRIRLSLLLASSCWQMSQHRRAMNLAKELCEMDFIKERCSVENWSAKETGLLLCQTSRWLVDAKWLFPEEAQDKYLRPALELTTHCENFTEPQQQLVLLMDRSLNARLAAQQSEDAAITKELRQQSKTEVQHLEEKLKQTKDPQSRHLIERLLLPMKKNLAIEIKKSEQEDEDIKTNATFIAKLLITCLSTTGTNALDSTRFGSRLVSLWFEFGLRVPEINQAIRYALNPPVKSTVVELTRNLRPFLYQIASRLSTEQDSFEFQASIWDAVVVMTRFWPFESLFCLIALNNGDKLPKDMKNREFHKCKKEKLEAATGVIKKVFEASSLSNAGRAAALRELFLAANLLSEVYIKIAFTSVDKTLQSLNFSSIKELKKFLPYCSQTPVPTAGVQQKEPFAFPVDPSDKDAVKKPGALSAYINDNLGIATIFSFEDTISLAETGISRPKIVLVTDSKGEEHKQVAKGNDDLRGDAVMEQLFVVVNKVFASSPETNLRSLAMRTYTVVPLGPAMGVVQWVTGTETLGNLLVGTHNRPTSGMHTKYRPTDWDNAKCRECLFRARQQDQGDIAKQKSSLISAYKKVTSNFKPVLHFIFAERFPDPQSAFFARKRYQKSLAVCAMIGFVVGLGDRHLNNILLDKKTAELVQIDFGIAFDKGKALAIPEKVPFRMTRDVSSALGCLGTEGAFRCFCEASLAVLRRNAPVILAILEVFLFDPLYDWSVNLKGDERKLERPTKNSSSSKVLPKQEDTSTDTKRIDKGNESARKALLNIRRRLQGFDENSLSAIAMSVEAHVESLVTEAQNEEILSQMFVGWAPWV